MKLERAILFLRISLGICFLWFGMLKFFSGMSPAEQLAIMTMDILTFGLIPSAIAIKLLAFWEVVIGIGFLFGKQIKWVLGLFFIHMALTFSPLVMFPEICFTQAPFALSLVGQYIVKNVVLIMGGVIIYILDSEVKQ
ncbi:DoxX family membrane protein [Sulfuricurvum sp.]|uniref:DoxX family membrane protein n=1 Tax=Sulfuricurvum sp. TaxID=2025608 RepID=UPI00286D71BF|nr:DoxX family membrane protein [Sulfuricurvum sp.]